MALESFERRGCLLKLETTEGVDSSPVVATDALQLLNGKSGLQSNQIERAIDRPYFGSDPFVSTMFRGSIEGEVELMLGAAAAGTASHLSTLLQIAAFAEVLDPTGPPPSTTYNPISTAIKSATGYFYHAGTLKKLLGARATMSGISMEIGKFPMAQIRIEGAASDIEEQALPTGFVYPSQSPVAVDPNTFLVSIDGNNVEGVAVNLDLGIELQTKQHSEGQVSRIVDRKPTGSIRCYRPLQSLVDVHAKWKSGAPVAVIGEVTGGSNNLTRITCGQAQIESIEEIELERDYGFDIKFRALPSSAGNDECLIAFE